MRAKAQDVDVFDLQRRQIEALQLAIVELQKQLMVPTVPLYDHQKFPDWSTSNVPVSDPSTEIYDTTTYPNRATEGQMVRELNAKGGIWTHGDDHKWHVATPARARLEKSIGATQPVAPIEDYVKFDYAYNTYPGYYEIGSTRDASFKVIFIQRPGVYCAQYRLNFDGLPGGHPKVIYNTQLFEPDWDGFVGYVTQHTMLSWNNEVHHSVIFIVPDDVLDMWPGNFAPLGITPRGMPMYITAWVDPDSTVSSFSMGGTGSPTDYSGTYLEVIRIGPTDMVDISGGRAQSGTIYTPQPDPVSGSVTPDLFAAAAPMAAMEAMPTRPLPGERRAEQIDSIMQETWEPRAI